MSRLIVNQIQGDAVTKNIEIPSGHTLYSPGHVIQYFHTVQTYSLALATLNTYVDYHSTQGQITITPKSTSSKILIECMWQAYIGNNAGSSEWSSINCRILRGSTVITAADPNTTDYMTATYGGDASREMVYGNISNFDSPATTSEITYKVQFNKRIGGSTQYVNRYGRGYMRVMEIAQ